MLNTDLKIRIKYPLVIVALALLSAFITAFVAYTHFEKEMRTAAESKLLALLDARKLELDRYLVTIHEDIQFQSVNPLVIEALRDFRWAWSELGNSPTKHLQNYYIFDKQTANGATKSDRPLHEHEDYRTAHDQFHPYFKNLLKSRGYYDIFLFDLEGNLVYSVVKELDFATNLVTGPWKDTALGKAYRAVRDNPVPGFMKFYDFENYGPSQGQPASFISAPMFNEVGTFIGVLAFQMPIGRIDSIMHVSSGMGETGETFIVGQDLLMRSDSRFVEQSTILKTRVDTVTVRKALGGEAGTQTQLDYRGVPVLSAYEPLDFLGTRWAIMAKINEDEVLAPVYEMRKEIGIAGIYIAILIASIGYFVSLNLSRPIVAMTEAMCRLARREKEIVIPSMDKGDEIGDMAKALREFQKSDGKRKQAEEELQKSQEVMRALSDNLPEFFSLKDQNRRFVFVNKRYEEWTGLKRKDVVGKTVYDLYSKDQAEEFDALDQKVMKEKSILSRELNAFYPGGGTRSLISTRFPVLSASGEIIGIGNINVDISVLKQTEDALRQSEERLKIQIVDLRDREERLEAQSGELVAIAENLAVTRDELKVLDDQKNKFFSIIAHDLKGPFNALLGYSSLLSTSINNFDKAWIKETAGIVHESGQRVFTLLENLLEWSRLQMGQVEFRLEEVNLDSVIEQNIALFQPAAEEKNISLIFAASEPVMAYADASAVDMGVRNLINNALKFTNKGGTITLTVASTGDDVRLQVIDTGVGMSPGKVAALFKIDVKTSTMGTDGEAGTGLGLELCDEFIRRQSGRIDVDSEEGVGSTFSVFLPAHRSESDV